MQVAFDQFDDERFSFHEDQVLILDQVWSAADRLEFQRAMREAPWTSLRDNSRLAVTFPYCGNWLKADLMHSQRRRLLDRLSLSCITRYIESFPNIAGRHVNFNYYSYAAGDCLRTHDDIAQDQASADIMFRPTPMRRLAMVTYLHDEWEPDWGGELVIYDMGEGRRDQSVFTVTHCIPPKPGSLVLFTVPRYHRVCRIDELCGAAKRLSIAGWFMTEHQPCTITTAALQQVCAPRK